MKRLALIAVLAACTPAPSGSVFPVMFRGTWSETTEVCRAPQVRIGAQTLEAYGSRCRLENWAAASAGGILARLQCVRPDGSRVNELARLRRRGPWLDLRVGDARLSWTSCD